MNRKAFLKTMALMPLTACVMKVNELGKLTSTWGNTSKMPVLFLGHGSPMNAIEENEFVAGFRNVSRTLEQAPRAILCISAHWETKGTFVTAMDAPKTIHDFGGFPQALFDVQYPAPGSPQLAKEVQATVGKTAVGLNYDWGLDHGAWSVLKHLYPQADIPIIQMSIDYTQPASYHYELGRELAALRNKGVLIVGSGNMVHNLRMVDWQRLNEVGYAYDWALEAKDKMNTWILNGNHDALIDYKGQGRAFELAIPSAEHYLPLLYTLALQEKGEEASLFNDKSLAGSLTMTSVKIA
jgi:4,5-DOPA dioxygenase extradiol